MLCMQAAALAGRGGPVIDAVGVLGALTLSWSTKVAPAANLPNYQHQNGTEGGEMLRIQAQPPGAPGASLTTRDVTKP